MNSLVISHQVNTELLTLQKVHENGLGFLIPSYQRPYVWSGEDVIKLFDDIKEAFTAGETQYFIGSALSARRASDDHEVYELIDGQQRTTTLMLISIAFKAMGVTSALAAVSVLGEQARLSFEVRDSVRNLLGSYAGLEKLARPGTEEIENDEYLKPLAANLTVVKQQVEKLEEEADFDMGAFADYLYRKVTWVNNIVPVTMDLNRLFSSMNTAGIQLEPVDLLKARLLKQIKTDKALYSQIWQACEYLENYFERNLRQLFLEADWNAFEYGDLKSFTDNFFKADANLESRVSKGKTLAMLLDEVNAGDAPDNADESVLNGGESEIDDETVYCRSIIGFELLLIHTLRIFCAQNSWQDLEPRIKAGNLMACFEDLLQQDEEVIKAFIQLLWQVRYQFDTWVVKWVEHDDREDPKLRLTSISRSQSGRNYYINRTAKELSELVQLQAVRNFTGDRSAHYWLTALLGRLIEQPDMTEAQVLATLEHLDNDLSLTTETQKEASFKIAKRQQPLRADWLTQEQYFDLPRGTSFEHYWFQKLEYLLWKQGNKGDEKLRRYRITSKNSVEHVHPQNEEHKNVMVHDALDAFGNLVLLSPGENSAYSNQAVLKKKADFESKPRYDSLKLKAIFELHTEAGNKWTETEIAAHQSHMLYVLSQHYQQGKGSSG